MACLLGGLSPGEGAEVLVRSMREGLEKVPGAGWHHGLVIGAGWHHGLGGGAG